MKNKSPAIAFLLLFLLGPACFAGGVSSHPGGALDQWLAGLKYPTIAPQQVTLVSSYALAPTPIVEVRRVLTILKPRSHEVFVDYGCGDGRWLIEAVRTYKCRGVGVEIDRVQAERTRQAIAAAGLADRVQIIEGDATAVNVEAQVGVAYLYADTLKRLKPKLLKLSRFATYVHRVDGVTMIQNGDTWIWQRPVQVQQVQRQAWYGGTLYTGRVCNNPGCAMCAEIARQLGQW